MLRPIRLLAVVIATAACGSDTDDRPVTWSYISAAIIQPNCTTASCHSSLTATGGLRLEGAAESHVILTGYSGNYVVPGDPSRSKLMYLLRGQDTWRMPPDQPLPEADILLIERWILEGALNN
jgi:hypothetical protein